MAPLKYLNNFWRSLEKPLINCETNCTLTLSANCVILSHTAANEATIFAITGKKLYDPIVTLSTDDNAKLLQQLKSEFKHTVNWNKYQSEVIIQVQNQYLHYLIDPNIQGVNRLFVLPFENNALKIVRTRYFLPTLEIKDHNVMIDGRNIFDQPVKSDMKRYKNIRKIATGKGDDYTTGCLLHYLYF